MFSSKRDIYSSWSARCGYCDQKRHTRYRLKLNYMHGCRERMQRTDAPVKSGATSITCGQQRHTLHATLADLRSEETHTFQVCSLALITHKFSVHIDRASICSVSSLSLYLSKNIRVNVDIGNCDMCLLPKAVSKLLQAIFLRSSALSVMNESTRLKHLRSRGRRATDSRADLSHRTSSQSSNISFSSTFRKT